EVVREAFERVGAMVCGRDSYDTAERAWGPEPPFRVPVFVLTHRPLPDDVRTGTSFHFVEGLETALARAREAAGNKDVALHGGSVIDQALAANLLDELNLQRVPVLLGAGRRLFRGLEEGAPRRLELIRTLQAPGALHLRYRALRSA